MLRFVQKGQLVLPVHDSFLVRESLREELHDEMRTAYRETVGTEPIIK